MNLIIKPSGRQAIQLLWFSKAYAIELFILMHTVTTLRISMRYYLSCTEHMNSNLNQKSNHGPLPFRALIIKASLCGICSWCRKNLHFPLLFNILLPVSTVDRHIAQISSKSKPFLSRNTKCFFLLLNNDGITIRS